MIDQLRAKDNAEILALTIYGEARGEFARMEGGLPALIAVANVVCNRLKQPERYGTSIKDVCLKKWQFSCWNDNDPNLQLLLSAQVNQDNLFQRCLEVARNVMAQIWPDITKGANHYYSKIMKNKPSWALDKTPQIQIGQHLFYSL